MAVTAAFVIDLVVMCNSRPALDILNTVLDYNIALIYSCTSLLLLTTQYVRYTHKRKREKNLTITH